MQEKEGKKRRGVGDSEIHQELEGSGLSVVILKTAIHSWTAPKAPPHSVDLTV